MHIFSKVKGKEKLRLKRRTELLMLIFALYSHALMLSLSENFSCLLRSLDCILAQLEMQACNVTLPNPVIFSCTFGVIIPDSQKLKRIKTKIAYNCA